MSTSKVQHVVQAAKGAGRWFPAGRAELKSMVNGFMDQAAITNSPAGRIVGAIAPHAGYQYSGKVAGMVYRAVRDPSAAGDCPDTVVILGFSHRGGFHGVALLAGDAVSTPLGETPLDAEAALILTQGRRRIHMDVVPHLGEHSAENQIPFVQAALPKARLVVALIGDHHEATRRELVAGLEALAKTRQLLVIASSDMLHDPSYEKVTQVDRESLKAVATLNVQNLFSQWSDERQIFCGIAPVLATMEFAHTQGCQEARVLGYRNSGDDFPESRGEWVVGYGAIVFGAPE